jgi:hypothetical protein
MGVYIMRRMCQKPESLIASTPVIKRHLAAVRWEATEDGRLVTV